MARTEQTASSKSVTEDDDNVYFTLEDDSVITIPKSDNSKFAITFDTTDVTILNGGEKQNNFLHDYGCNGKYGCQSHCTGWLESKSKYNICG